MSDYACASCAGPVSEGRCPTCRVSRESLRRNTPQLTREMLLQLLLALAVVLAALAVAVEHAG